LQWNSPERQQAILSEVSRIINNFAIIQHAGADIVDTKKWRERMDNLLCGNDVQKVKRSGHFFSSREEIETIMTQNGIRFEKVKERKVEKVSNVFIERYALDESEAKVSQDILGDSDYIIQTTWILFPKK
jgi:hypothetical protein